MHFVVTVAVGFAYRILEGLIDGPMLPSGVTACKELLMPIRRKCFISYHHADQAYVDAYRGENSQMTEPKN